MKLVKSLLVGLLLLGGSSFASASDYYVDITNDTGYTILYMYVSPAKAETWEEDVLGSSVFRSGETQRVTLTNFDSPMFDIRLVDEDKDSYTFWDVDVSQRDIVVTLGDLD